MESTQEDRAAPLSPRALQAFCHNSSYTEVLVVSRKTSFTFLCSKDFLRITDGMGKRLDQYCGNKTGERLRVTGDQVELMFRSDNNVEQRGYYLVFTLVSHGK